jgi:hypothetical protein
MLEIEQQISALTPEELTILANSYDRPALAQAVARLRSLMPSLRAAPQADLTTVGRAGLGADDESTTTTLTPPDYSLCASTPSDPSVDYGLFIALQVASGVQIPFDYFCDEIVEILGEGTNLPFCVVDIVLAGISWGLDLTLQAMDFCNPVILGAENHSAWLNTIAIFNNLETDTENINEHLISVDSNLNTHATAIDADVNSNLTAIDTDIDAHVAAADLDLATRVGDTDADLNNHLTALDTHLTAVDGDVKLVGGDVATLQALELRIKIEKSLASGIYVGSLEAPQAQGGYLELVGTTVQTVINGLVAAGQRVGGAQTLENAGNTAYSAGLFKRAYADYMSAYQAATSVGP